MSKKITYCKDVIESVEKYSEYVKSHIENVKTCYIMAINAFKDVFPNVYKNETETFKLISNIKNHDKSKIEPDELFAYAHRFFPIEGEDDPKSKENKDKFKLAWFNHVSKNPHHPSYWVLVDNNGTEIFDMPDIYIIEMLCDWMAMSKHFNSTTLEYWQSESAQKLPMSNYTKFKVNEFMMWMQKNNVHTLW
jgi:hypothetical protein